MQKFTLGYEDAMVTMATWLATALRKRLAPTFVIGDIKPTPTISADLIAEADRLRDTGNAAAAAAAYKLILEHEPYLTGIRVQYGNMLKDSRELPAAESAYRQALVESPDDADIHLQLGHVLKLLGRRPAALAAYKRAAELDPLSHAALRELSAAGQPEALLRAFDAQIRHDGMETLLHLTDEVASFRAQLAKLAETLPDARAAVAFPIGRWNQFRKVFDVPPPPSAAGTIGVLLWSDPAQPARLYAQLAALRMQSHPNWRATVLGSDVPSREVVERAAVAETRIGWHEADLAEPPGCAEIRACCLEADWLVLAGPGAILHPHALGWVLEAHAMGGAPVFVFDEETVETEPQCTIRSTPVLRQVVDYDTLLETNVFGQTVAIRKDTFLEMSGRLLTTSVAAMRSSILLESRRIGHIPLPLVHGTVPDLAADQEAHLQAMAHYRPTNTVQPIAASKSGITVVILTRNNVSDVRDLTESLKINADHPDALDILVIDNGGSSATARALEGLRHPRLRVARVNEPFNWSRLNNWAALQTDAPILVFANDDMRMLTKGWDDVLRRLLERQKIGAVGVRLLYPDDTLQHAGILMGWHGGVIHDGLHHPSDDPGPLDRWQVTRAVGAVTGAFLATRRDIFRRVHGFDEAELPVSYSDVDYALKLREAGLRVLWTPHITLYHHESKTRGLDHDDEHKAVRNDAEHLILSHRWGQALTVDPSVHPLWLDAALPFRLVSPMSKVRMLNHIRYCAAAEPWYVARVPRT